MSFDIKCSVCGKIHTVDDKYAGRTAKCPCGERLTLTPPVPAAAPEPATTVPPPLDIPGATLKIPLGRIPATFGSLTLECEVSTDRLVSMMVYASSNDSRTKGVIMYFNEATFEQLKGLIAKAAEVFASAKR